MLKKNFYLLVGIFLILVEFFITFFLVPKDAINSSFKYERKILADKCGKSDLLAIGNFAYEYEQKIIYDTQLNNEIRNLFIPNDDQYKNSRFISSMGKPFFNYLSERFSLYAEVFHEMLIRLGYIKLWLGILVMIYLSSITTGFLERKIKLFNFALSSTVKFVLAIRSLKICLLSLFIILFWPLYIHPDLFIILGLMIAIFINMLCANLQKRI